MMGNDREKRNNIAQREGDYFDVNIRIYALISILYYYLIFIIQYIHTNYSVNFVRAVSQFFQLKSP